MDKWQKYFKAVVLETSKLSTCCKTHVGAILVKDNRIISTGYNGVPSGKEHCEEYFRKEYEEVTKFMYESYEEWKGTQDFKEAHHKWSEMHETHGEVNVLGTALRNGISTKDCDLYCTLQPCINCSKLIVSSGIKRVFYLDDYWKSSEESLAFLKNNGVEVIKI